jgi:hypothetical protein
MRKATPASLALVVLALPVLLAMLLTTAASEPQVTPRQAVPLPRPQVRSLTPILARSTGKVVGYKDPKTGNLVFTTMNRVIRSGRIQHVSKEEFERLMKKYGCNQGSISDSQLKMMGRAPRLAQAFWNEWDKRTADPNDDWYSPAGGGATEGNDDCVELCWLLAEGGAKCQGCCKPIGDGACYCWEYCSDYASSIEK